MTSLATAVQDMFGEASLIEASLVDLVVILAELTEDENEIFAAIDELVEDGRVQLVASIGRHVPEAA